MQFDHRPVQGTMFRPPRDLEPVGLYHVVEYGDAVAERDSIRVEPHTGVSTNTYFGRFPASYWQRWTTAGRVQIQASVKGEGTITLVASDFEGSPRNVDSVRVQAGQSTIEMQAPLNQFIDGGSFWLEIYTADAPLEISQVRWYTNITPREHGAAVVICTFNRADDCLTTMRTLANDARCDDVVTDVYVVDQGTDPVESREGFAGVKATLGDRLHYLRQPNLGGAGGFTRGIFEVKRAGGELPNVLLMDDDIVLEPETVLRMVAFANRTHQPALTGGQMLRLLHPDELHVSAEQSNLDILRAGMPVPDALAGANLLEELQDLRVDTEYNAWWACLLPPEAVAKVGLPLPVFFQWDDIEYGLRSREHGFPTVTLPGAGVWHADFAWKDWDDWPRYFSVRNSLIVSALHSEFNLRSIVYTLFRDLATYLVSMRYGLAATLILAVEDFLSGPEVLRDGGAEAAAKIRKLRAEYPETQVHPAYGAAQVPIVPAAPDPSIPTAVMIKRIVWQLMGLSRGAAAVRAEDNNWWHTSLFNTAVVTDPSQAGVKILKRDKAVARDLGMRGAKVLRRLYRDGQSVRRSYQTALPNLTSEENWARLFGVPAKPNGDR